MKLWLRKPGSSEFVGPLTLDEIRAQIESGSLSWDFEALEAAGQSQRALKRSLDWAGLSSVCAPESVATTPPQETTSAQGQSPAAFLETVRRQTCYSALRERIALFAVLSIIVVVVLAGFYIVVGLQSQSVSSIIIGVVVGVLGCFLVIASKQASLLLVDIADTLIEQNRKKSGDKE